MKLTGLSWDTDFVQLTFNIVYYWKPQLEKSLFS